MKPTEGLNNRTLVVTGCDANHFQLAEGLIRSLGEIKQRAFDIGFIQVGDIAPPAAIRANVNRYATEDVSALSMRGGDGFTLAAIRLKSRLPEIFPGYDTYVWMDGDTWVQNSAGIEDLVQNAGKADIYISLQIDPAYWQCFFPDNYTMRVYDAIFGREVRDQFSRRPMVNSGVFSAKATSPLWRKWESLLVRVNNELINKANRFYSDQIPLHYLIFKGELTFHPLPSVNNWLVHHAPPLFSQESCKLVTPLYPHAEINVVHLLGEAKTATLMVLDRPFRLTYEGMQQAALATREASMA